jgi:phage terminase large subunit-like protein
LRNTNSWVISNWQTSMRERKARSGHEITVTIESPTESQHLENVINFNNDDNDDEEDNWSDITVL